MSPAGRYQLLDRIAKGGMAELFRARAIGEQGFSKLLAIKRILPQWADDSLFVKMLVDEARIVASLNHPNIVQVHELGRDEQGYFIAMELVLGPNLAALLDRLIERGQRLPRACALDVAIHLLNALDYAHARTDGHGQPLHLVHRDVSPENVLLTAGGVVKLADFGVAKAKNRLVQTEVGLLKGKLPYMSPEQVRGGEIDGRSDLFAAGLVLWECLAGRLRYDAENEYDLVQQVEKNRGPSLQEVGVVVEPELDAALARALSTDPDERFQTAGEFARELTRHHRRLYPDYGPSVLGEFVGDLFGPELEKFEQNLRRLQTGDLSALGYAGLETQKDLEPPPVAARSANKPRSTGEQRTSPRPAPEPAAPPPVGPEEEKAIEAALAAARAEERRERAQRGVSLPMLAVSFVLAGGGGVGAVMLLERAGGTAPTETVGTSELAPTVDRPDADAPESDAAGAPVAGERGDESGPGSSSPVEPTPERPAARPSRLADEIRGSAPPARSDRMGLLDVFCEPECEVYLNGRRIGSAPLLNYALPAGRHQLSVRNRLLELQRSLPVEVAPGETTVKRVNLVREGKRAP